MFLSTALPVSDVAAFTIVLPADFTKGENTLFKSRSKPQMPRPRCNLSPPLKRRDILILYNVTSVTYLSRFLSNVNIYNV